MEEEGGWSEVRWGSHVCSAHSYYHGNKKKLQRQTPPPTHIHAVSILLEETGRQFVIT